jgi:hypothetical protein
MAVWHFINPGSVGAYRVEPEGIFSDPDPVRVVGPHDSLEGWRCSAKKIQELREEALGSTMKILKSSGLQAAEKKRQYVLLTLGKLFHVCADHYSHTNWVENSSWTIEGVDFNNADQRPFDKWNNTDIDGNVSKDTPKKALTREDHEEAYFDAVNETIRQWYWFEKKLFEKSTLGDVLSSLDKLGVKPGFNFVFSNFFPVVLGERFPLAWHVRGIPLGSKVKMELWKHGKRIGEIHEFVVTHLKDPIQYWPYRFDWIVGEYSIGQGEGKKRLDLKDLKEGEFVIRLVLDKSPGLPEFSEDSLPFKINQAN